MKDGKTQKTPANPQTKVRTRLLEMARIIRRTGTPDEAMEAAEWEKLIQKKIDQPEAVAQAA